MMTIELVRDYFDVHPGRKLIEIKYDKEQDSYNFSKGDYSVTVKTKDVHHWIDGLMIQQAMPYLSSEQREFLISGLTPDEWFEIFSSEFFFTFGQSHEAKISGVSVPMKDWFVETSVSTEEEDLFNTSREEFIECFSSKYMKSSDSWAFQYDSDSFDESYFPLGCAAVIKNKKIEFTAEFKEYFFKQFKKELKEEISETISDIKNLFS